jgi:molybdate transport system substrate-binding protein
MNTLNILSGGAAQGLVKSLAPVFRTQTGFDIAGEFGAVGAMADKLRKGTPADIIILTATIVARLSEERLVVPTSIKDVGLVDTALAVRAGDPSIVAKDSASLRAAFLASDAIFVPDTKSSTAGIHVAKVLAQIGIDNEVSDRLRIYPNGTTAMRHMAETDARRPIGCTQATEIIATEGIVLSGSLPPGCDLATMYTAAVTTGTAAAQQAQSLIDLLTAADANELRNHAGFVSRSN